MESNRTGTILSAFSLGLIGLCFALLVHESIISRQSWAELPRLLGGFAAPIPVALYLAFCFVQRAGEPPKPVPPRGMVLFFALSIAATIVLGLVFRADPPQETVGSAPAIAESAIFSGSILNFILFRNPLIAALLSGLSIGMTIWVIFLL